MAPSRENSRLIIDPDAYSNRDLLLLTQLLHTQGYIDPKSIKSSDPQLENISNTFFHHPSTQLSIKRSGLVLEKPWTRQQCFQVYQNLLKKYPDCKTTTDLANRVYFLRVEELTSKVNDIKQTFPDLLES